VDKCSIGMSSLVEWSQGPQEPPCVCCHGATHDGVHPQQHGHGCSGTVGPRSRDQPADLLGQSLCCAWRRAELPWGSWACSPVQLLPLSFSLVRANLQREIPTRGGYWGVYVYMLSYESAVGIDLHPRLLVSAGFLPLPAPPCSRAGKAALPCPEARG